MSTKEKEVKVQYTYGFKEIVTRHFSVTEHSLDIENLVEKLRLDFGTGFKFHEEINNIAFDLNITATSEIEVEKDDKKSINELECFEINLRNLFLVHDLKKHIEEDNIKKDEEFLVLLASLSYSSARGIINEKLSGTRYKGNFLLPVIDPRIFVGKKKKDEENEKKKVAEEKN